MWGVVGFVDGEVGGERGSGEREFGMLRSSLLNEERWRTPGARSPSEMDRSREPSGKIRSWRANCMKAKSGASDGSAMEDSGECGGEIE